MRTAILIAAAVLAFSSVAASAQGTTSTTTKRTVTRGDHTVIISRDESGRTRTRIVVQKRSFLDPGTQVFPGEQRYNDGPALVWQPPFTNPQSNTVFNRTDVLPGRFDLPFNDNPVYWSRD